MAAQLVATASALAAGTLSVPGIDCSSGGCSRASMLAMQIQTDTVSGALSSETVFTQRFEMAVTLTSSGAAEAVVGPTLVSAMSAAATGESTSAFTTTVTLLPALAPALAPAATPAEDEETVIIALGWLITAIALCSVVCVVCTAICLVLCRRSAPVGGMKDGSGIGMQRAAAAARRAAREAKSTNP